VIGQESAEAYPRTLAFLLKSGATLQRRYGRMVAAHYGSVATEMAICLKGAGVALRPDIEAVQVTAEPVALADGLASCLEALPPGPGEARCFGGVWVGRLAARSALVIGPPPALDRCIRLFGLALGADVDTRSREATAIVSVVGPRSEELLGMVGVVTTANSQIRLSRVAGADVVILDQGRGWFTVAAPAASIDAVWHALLKAGRDCGAMPVGCDAIDRLTASHRFSTTL
jgi:hypothetical protein